MKYFIGFFILVITNNCLGQKYFGTDLLKLSPLFEPDVYKRPGGQITKAGAKRSMVNKDTEPWIVYSDRENNVTFKDKSLTQKYSVVNFMQAFYVAEENDWSVRLVKYDQTENAVDEKGAKLLFNEKAEDEGWIDKKNLLLWNNSLVDSITKYSKKAITVKKIEDRGDDIKKWIKRGVLDLYSQPIASPEFDNGKDVELFQYLFILKYDKESRMYLLSRANRLSPLTVFNDVIGWAPASQLHVWNSALCLRVNMDEKAIEERKKESIEIQFFKTIDRAKLFKEGGSPESMMFWYNDEKKDGKEKENPYLLGYPIIEYVEDDSSIFKTGYVTNTLSSKGDNIFTARTQAKNTQIYEELKIQKEQVYMIFVLDGSSQSFISSLISAIKDIRISDDSKNKYRYGAIIYNDVSCGDDEFQVKKFSVDKKDIIEWLTEKVNDSNPCLISREKRELNGAPIFSALKMAADMFNNERSTNVVFLTGYVTDKDKSKRDIALNALIDKQVKLYSFQLFSNEGPLYNGYARDFKYLLKNTADTLDAKYFNNDFKDNRIKKSELVCDEEKNYCFLINSGTMGGFYWKNTGERFQARELNDKIKRISRDIENKLNDLLAMYYERTSGKNRNAPNADEDNAKKLKMLLMDCNIPESEINQIAFNENYQIFLEAYTSVTNKKLTYPLLVKTLFVSKEEYDRIEQVFFDLVSTVRPNTTRTKLIEAIQQLILNYKGGSENKKTSDYSLDEFLTLVTDIPPTGNKLLKLKLKELGNVSKVRDDQIKTLKLDLNNIYLKLKEIKKKNSNQMTQNDETFYWIPEKTFHINE